MGKTVKRRTAVIFVFFVLPFFALLTQAEFSFALSSINVPLDHWSYSALDKFQGFGLIKSDIHSARPFTRLEVARLLIEAMASERYVNKNLPPLLNHLFERFQREFKTELEELNPSGVAARSFFKPVEEIQARYVYVDGKPRAFLGFPPDFKDIRASEGTPLHHNDEGKIYTEGSNFSFQFSSSARFLEIFSAYVEPILIARENERKARLGHADNFEIDLNKGYLKISPWNIEIEAGRDSLWWGQGYHGTLVLGNNAPPFDMLKLSNPNPTILPWIFSYLGLFKYTIFAARLDDDRDFPHPIFTGIHLVIKPHPVIEIGATYTQMFGGQGAPTGPSFPGAFGTENGLMSFDARVRLPFLRNAEVYAEYGGEDSSSDQAYWYEPIFQDLAYLVGIYFPVIFDNGRTDFRVEYANNAFERGPKHIGFWYGHGIYTSGYTFEKMIMGHPMGPDASDLFVRASHYITDRLQLGVDYDYMKRGLTLGTVVEKINTAGADLTYEVNKWLSISGRYSLGAVDNFNMVKDDDRTHHLFITGVKLTF